MKKHLLFLIVLLTSLTFYLSTTSFINSVDAEKGVVVWLNDDCDYFIVETRTYFVLTENYYSKDIRKGDKVIGNLHGYGFKELYNVRKDDTQKVYIENYWGSISRCFEWLKDNEECEE